MGGGWETGNLLGAALAVTETGKCHNKMLRNYCGRGATLGD